eukprot:g11859.t1
MQVLLICCFFGLSTVLPHANEPQQYKLSGCHKKKAPPPYHEHAAGAAGNAARSSRTPSPHGAHGMAREPDIGPPPKYLLELRLTDKIKSQKALKETCYGFNLKKSNELGLVRPRRDLRNEQCRARSYRTEELPKASAPWYRKRVVVPNIVAIDINELDFIGGSAWPPVRGIFNWRLTFIGRDLYVPDEDSENGGFLSVSKAQCLTGGPDSHGPVQLDACKGRPEQNVEFTSQNYIQFSAHINHHLVCLRTQIMAQVPCSKGSRWKMDGTSLISLDRTGDCLTRSPSGEALDVVKCKGLPLQRWLFDNPGTLSGPEKDLCIDNMQRSQLRSGEGSNSICLGFDPTVALAPCAPDDLAFKWIRKTSKEKGTLGFQSFSPAVTPEQCMVVNNKAVELGSCTSAEHWWKFPYSR